MAPGTRKRKISETPEVSDDSYESMSTPRAPKRAAPRQKRRPAAKRAKSLESASGDENVVDEGRSKSKSFFVSANAAKTPRTNPTEVRKDLRKEVDKLVQAIDQAGNEEAPHQDMLDRISGLSGNVDILPYAGGKSGKSSSKTKCSIGERAHTILQGMRKSIEEYEVLNSQDPGIKRPLAVRWDQDVADLSMLNAEMVELAIQTVTELITSEQKLPGANVPDERGLKKLAEELWDEKRPHHGQKTWGMMAQGVSRGITELLRAVDLGNSGVGRAR